MAPIEKFEKGKPTFFGHKETANQFSDPEYLYGTPKLEIGESPTVTPAFLNLKNPKIFTEFNDYEKHVMEGSLNPNKWKKKGYDGVIYAPGGNFKDPDTYFVTFEPTQIKSAIGNQGTFNSLDPDITKAEGGKINPIKSPREMLFELAGLPAMAGGGKTGMATNMYKLITDAIERYTKMYGRPPSPDDVKALKDHAAQISKKPEIKTDPATQARARHEMATNPNLINPEGPDPFLTKALTGRTVKGTYLKPKVQDINDPNVQANIEAKQMSGELDEIMPESITPSADYFGRTSTALENEALGAGKIPLIDKLKAAFFAKNKRAPTEEELEMLIAEFNPLRHQYGAKGASIVTERPPTAKGMSDWRQQARTEGIPEAYLEKPPADYPQYLRDELDLGQGIQPGTKPLPATRINPDRAYAAGGSITPEQMLFELMARGKEPQKFKSGGESKRGYQKSADVIRDFFLGMRDAPREVVGGYADMILPRGVTPMPLPSRDEMTVPRGRLIPFPDQGSGGYEAGKTTAALIGDPLNLLLAGPAMQGIKRVATAPFKFAAKNPVKSSVMMGTIPATSIGSDDTYEK
jgi:hypothetical protein